MRGKEKRNDEGTAPHVVPDTQWAVNESPSPLILVFPPADFLKSCLRTLLFFPLSVPSHSL